MAKRPELITDMVWFDGKLMEDAGDGVSRLKGVFQRCDVKNANGRVYPRSVWEATVRPDSLFMQRLNERAVVGHLEHPSDGVTSLRQAAVVITGIQLDAKGQIVGEAEILPTPDGHIVKTLVERGVRVGISSRGKGTVGPDGVVGPDFALETFDIVNSPSTPGAYPKPVEETEESSKQTMEENIMSAAPAPAAPALDPQFQTEAVNGFTARVNALMETDVSVLPKFQVSQLSSELTSLSVQLGNLAENCPAVRGAVTGLQNALNEKRSEISRVSAPAEGGTAADALPVESDAAMDLDVEEDDATGQVDAAAADITALRADLLRAETLYDSMTEALRTVRGENEELRHRLADACRAIESRRENGEDVDVIEEAVHAVLEVVPELEPIAQNIYQTAQTVEAVFNLAHAAALRLGINATAGLQEAMMDFVTDNEDDDEDGDDDDDEDEDGEWDDRIPDTSPRRQVQVRGDRQYVPRKPLAGEGNADAIPNDTDDFNAAESMDSGQLESRPLPGGLTETNHLSLVERIAAAESGHEASDTVTLAEAAILSAGGV